MLLSNTGQVKQWIRDIQFVINGFSLHCDDDKINSMKNDIVSKDCKLLNNKKEIERLNKIIAVKNVQIEKRKKRFVKYAENSNLWQCVISFNNDYLNENISLQELEQELIKNVLPRFFRKMGFKDKKCMAYNLSFHTDTDNLHIHFSFIEKKPNYVFMDKLEK